MPNKESYVHYHFGTRKNRTHASYYPIISNVQVTVLGLVTWTTDIPSTSQVNYGLNPLIGALSPFDATLVTSHSVQLSGLTNNLLYYFRVQSFFSDALSISDLYAFQFIAQALFILLEGGTFMVLEDGTKIRMEIP